VGRRLRAAAAAYCEVKELFIIEADEARADDDDSSKDASTAKEGMEMTA